MTIPVVIAFCRTNPDIQLTMLTSGMGKKIYDAVSDNVPNLTVRGLNLKKDYNGIGGLNRLYGELKAEQFDAVADLHDVLRTKWLRLRFMLSGVRVAKIDKGRNDKKALVRHTSNGQLKSGFQRYQDVFEELGMKVDMAKYDTTGIRKRLAESVANDIPEQAIGIAPFAMHRGKIYPKAKMQEVIGQLLTGNPMLHIYLFGGSDEAQELDTWTLADSQRIHNLAGRQGIADDIRLMARLSGVISMDSSNMHLASLVGTRVISIWGATHPHAGFLGFRQSPEDVVSLPLPCRPCSIYGNKPCRYGHWKCMEDIDPKTICQRLTGK